ncbi:hypothetical protein BJY01DRAFT_237075 [Aspergillus pseudoustus]|uniref:Aminoglycoside phosphotransferase domain-containing protein n=1 Tax=Aspergillus pseudoustus TaxID=1810923 RepID=A0ABR4JIV0_9EURO
MPSARLWTRNPATDLLSVVGKRYRFAHRVALSKIMSEAGQLNIEKVYHLEDKVISSSETNLRDHFPSDYHRRYRWAKPKVKREEKPVKDWHPHHCNSQRSLANGALKDLTLRSERLFELRIHDSVVAKCSDSLVIKISSGTRDHTEYHNLQYLAEHVPNLPIPKPHGLVELGRAMFVTYIPDTTLEKTRPTLPPGAKASIQSQLDAKFSRLRSLRQDDEPEHGGIRGEGFKDYRIIEIFAYKGITTAREFDQLQFSAKHLEEEDKSLAGSVFTHGDLMECNIIVQEDPGVEGSYLVTCILDWEDSGFKPEYYECTILSSGQSIDRNDDWYLFALHCISPLRFPVRWLVDRLWGNLLWSWRTDIVR